MSLRFHDQIINRIMPTLPKHVLLTGRPGIGKTTIIKEVCIKLKEQNKNIQGFYTEEVRNDFHRRIGFDVITLDGRRDELARASDSGTAQFKVGQYQVYRNKFENVVLPLFDKLDNGILILDEIGKMELFSNIFKTKVESTFANYNVSILATIPIKKGKPIDFVESLRNNPTCHLIELNEQNRNSADLQEQIVAWLE